MTFKEAMRYGPCAGRTQSTERIPGVAGMLGLADKERKSAIVICSKIKETISKELEENMRKMSHQIENIQKRQKILKGTE